MKEIIDHTGQKHESFSAMCRHWGLPRKAVHNRILRGATLQEALETPRREVRRERKNPLSEEEMARIRYERYKEKNGEKIREYRRAYKEAHRAEENAKQREYYKKNKAKITAYRNSPEMKLYHKEYNARYREKLKAKAQAQEG